MPLSPLEYLRHILDETEYLTSQRAGLSKDQFLQDATLKRAFVRSIGNRHCAGNITGISFAPQES
ncbi:MAG: hypothetical protein NTZ51_07485 [Proteobacteria bacterium]|nr:hypothetical protein [Pseudomonadota bacterium]